MPDPALPSLLSRVEAATGADREIEAFLAMCIPEPNSGCWLWTGSATQDRYGYWKTRFKGKVAARAAYELLRGSFDARAFICHHCDNSACVNPDHLYVGDHRGASLDREAAGEQPLALATCYSRVDKMLDAGYVREVPYTDFSASGIAFTRYWYFTTAQGRAARRWHERRSWWRRIAERIGLAREEAHA